MATQITVDLDRCQGHGKCYLLAPTVYAPIEDDDWGKAEARVSAIDEASDPDGALLRQAELGQRSCPEAAIVLTSTAPAASQPSHS